MDEPMPCESSVCDEAIEKLTAPMAVSSEKAATLDDALGQIDAPAHGNAVHRSEDSNEKQHPVSHSGIRKFTGNQQIQNAGMLQHPVKEKNQNQKGRCPSEIRFSDSRFQQNLISCLTDYLPEFFQRHPVRIKSNVCRSLLITDLRALNARCLF